jgi:hypothetical protein
MSHRANCPARIYGQYGFMPIEHAATDSRAKELIAYAYLHAVDNEGVLHSHELEFMKKIALKDGVIDDTEARVLHEILQRINLSKVSAKVKTQVGAFQKLYPAADYTA